MKLQSLLFAFAANTLMPHPLMAGDSTVSNLLSEVNVPKCAGVASQGEVLNLEEKKTLLLSACGVENDRQALIKAFNEPSSEDALKQVLCWMTEDRLKRSTMTSNWATFMLGVLKILEEFEDDKRHAFVLQLEQNGVMTRCCNILDIYKYLRIFRNSTTEKMNQAMRWVKETGIWEVCKSGEFHLPNLLELVKDYDQEQLGCVTSFLKTTGILSQYCHQNNPYEPRRRLAEVLDLLKTCRTEQLEFLAQWMKETGVLDKYPNTGHAIIEDLWDYDAKRLTSISTWMRETGAWEKLSSWYYFSNFILLGKSYDESLFINALSENYVTSSGLTQEIFFDYFMRHFPDGDSVESLRKLKAAAIWINESYSEKFYSSEVKELFSTLKNYDFEYLKLITPVLKEMHWLDTMQPWNLTLALRRLENGNKETFPAIISWMKESGVLATCNDVECFLNVISSIHKCGPEDLRDLIENGVVPENVIEVLIRVLGETHPITQNLIELAIGHDNQRNPNSPFAVYCEMRKKSNDEVEHRQPQLTTGLSLQLNSIKEPRPAISIHMPFNVWERLFEQFEIIDQSTCSELFGDISRATILKLKYHHDILRLLDPKDSLKVNKKISSHSHMLREVLKKAQEDFRLDHENIGSFVQLLVNITTCQTGKLNGITHSYIYMNQGRVLDESVLGAKGFKQEIVSFFKEELRRFREATLTAIVRNITRMPQADPHDLYYVRGIIGREIGLFFENETPTVDIYAWGVSGKLRKKTKQQLLDLFYQYYKVEDVVDRVHSMLNNGSINISNDRNLTLCILNEYLREEAMDETLSAWDPELVVLDSQQKPLGLTPKAAQRLLEILEFVVKENKREEAMKT